VADVQYVDHLLFLDDAVDYTVNMRFAAIEKVPDCLFLGCYRTAAWEFFQSEDLPLQTLVPFPRGIGPSGADLLVQILKIPLGAKR